MSEKGFGTITISDLQDGSQIWTSTNAPTSPDYTFTISDLVGDDNTDPKVGDVILYSSNRYTITSIGTTTVLTGMIQSLKGDKGDQGYTPTITNGYWYINGQSTGVKAEGVDGTTSVWYYGNKITGTSTTPIIIIDSGIAAAVVGDMYLNTDTSAMYQCKSGGAPSVAKWAYVGTMSDAISVGGRNLIWDSKWDNITTRWTNWGSPATREIVEIDGKRWLHLITTANLFQGYQQDSYRRSGLYEIKPGDQLTASFTAYAATEGANACIGLHWRDSNNQNVAQNWFNVSLTTTPKRYTYVVPNVVPNNTAIFNIMVGHSTAVAEEIWISEPKLEMGNMATDWTPAPEDVEAAISEKRRVFSAQPTPPYDEGDLWAADEDIEDSYTYYLTEDTEIDSSKTYYTYDEATDEYTEVTSPVAADLPNYYERSQNTRRVIYICINPQASGGTFSADDWTVSSTDDTAANDVRTDVTNLSGIVDNHYTELDGKISEIDTDVDSLRTEVSAVDGKYAGYRSDIEKALDDAQAANDKLSKLDAYVNIIGSILRLAQTNPEDGSISAFSTELSATELQFKYNGNVMAYMNALGFNFLTGIVREELRIGNFVLKGSEGDRGRFDIVYQPLAAEEV